MHHRINQRADVRECVRRRADLENARADECPAVTLDLSNSGARLLTSGHVDAGDRVALTLYRSDGSHRFIRATGIAVRSCSLEADRLWGRMLAVEFDAPLSDSAEFDLGHRRTLE